MIEKEILSLFISLLNTFNIPIISSIPNSIVFFLLVKSLASSSAKAYTWNVNEYEYALTLENDEGVVDEKNFSTEYDFNRDKIKSIELNVGYIKSSAVITYLTSDEKKATATLTWSSNDGGKYLIRVQDANAIIDTYLNEKSINYSYEIVDSTNQFTFMDFLVYVFPTLITIVIAFILIRSIMRSQGGNNQTFDFGKSKARLEDSSKTRFSSSSLQEIHSFKI